VTAERRTVEVWADFQGREGSALMGLLSATPARGKEIFSFEYDTNWLKAGRAQSLDPALRLLRGPQYLADGRDNFGLFLDSSPDRWGRLLLLRREALVARDAKRAERRLTELDFLLGVYDGHRMGGLSRGETLVQQMGQDADRSWPLARWCTPKGKRAGPSRLSLDCQVSKCARPGGHWRLGECRS